MMSFSCESLCRACMEPYSGNSMPLMNKKKHKKTPICNNFEELTCLKVKDGDQLPQQLCLACVSELNKCFAFREKCIRTNSTLRTYLDLSDDSDDGMPEEKFTVKKTPVKRKLFNIRDSKEETYEEIEVTEDLIEASKNRSQDENVNTEMVLEMDDITNLLNPIAQSSPNEDVKITSQDENNLVFIIQNVSNDSSNVVQSTSTIKSNTSNYQNESKEKFRCKICEMEFVRRKNYDNHMQRFHSGEEEETTLDKKRLRLKLTNDKDNDQSKQELEENPEAKKCKTCGALYLNEKSLRLHERRNACKQESYQCDVCKKVFTDQNLFTEHTKSHPQQEQEIKIEEPFDPSKKFNCTICPKAFRMLSTLKDHLRTHTGDKPFKCTICGRGFSQNTNLKQHLRRHTQIKPFKCTFDNCEASFVSKGELESHNRKHTGAHPYSCDQCNSTFTTSSSLVKHKRIHSGEKPYVCEFCPLRFTALGTLRNHIRTHTGEKPHKCKFCGRAFTQKSDMSAHERTHTGDRPFVCTICNSAFHQSGTLRTHLKIHSKPSDADDAGEEETDDD